MLFLLCPFWHPKYFRHSFPLSFVNYGNSVLPAPNLPVMPAYSIPKSFFKPVNFTTKGKGTRCIEPFKLHVILVWRY